MATATLENTAFGVHSVRNKIQSYTEKKNNNNYLLFLLILFQVSEF